MNDARQKVEYGDFQTPRDLANEVAGFLKSTGISPAVIVEPTCGIGSFVYAALLAFPDASSIFSFDVNEVYIRQVRDSLGDKGGVIHVETRDFFEMDWKAFFKGLKGDILIIGNPPWVTNSALGSIGATNLPLKSNFQNHGGFAAKTGKANFDISEWMLIRLLDSLPKQRAWLAMLCKTMTARKVLKHAWLNQFPVDKSSIHLIDAQAHFGVSVDACLLVVHIGKRGSATTAGVYDGLSFSRQIRTIGMAGRELVSDVNAYAQLRDLDGLSYYKWRSGVKHDASRVMELTREQGGYKNGLGEFVDIEDAYLYPLLKSSDLASGKPIPSKYVLLTQRQPNDDTLGIRTSAPNTWNYLSSHADILDGRQSMIYRKRPRFSVFGIGEYTFAPWKVAVSGFYKSLRFQVIGSFQGKPLVVDDTCYFVPCESKQEAAFVVGLMNSDLCQRFLHSLVFIDAKRPITVDILDRVDLRRLANKLGMETYAKNTLMHAQRYEKSGQASLVFEKENIYRASSSGRRAEKHH